MKTINVGCEYWCKHPRLPYPVECVVIVITDEAGKQVGVELNERFSMTHNLDGKLSSSRGMWVLASQLMTTEEYRQSIEVANSIQSFTPQLFDSIDVDDDKPVTFK